MSDELKLEDVDVDGAVREAHAHAVEVLEKEGDTRAGFLKRVGMAGGAFMGGGAMLAALAPSAMGATARRFDRPPSKIFGTGDTAILNYALVLEYLEADFYSGAIAHQRNTGFLDNNPPLREFLEVVYKDETAHVALLRAALGGAQIHSPKFNFHGDNQDQGRFENASFALENTGVHAYLGQVLNLSNTYLVQVAATIVTVEARHAGVIGQIAKATVPHPGPIAPNGPRDAPQGAAKVLKTVEGTHYVTKLYKAPHHT
jgi:hypothetical protein